MKGSMVERFLVVPWTVPMMAASNFMLDNKGQVSRRVVVNYVVANVARKWGKDP